MRHLIIYFLILAAILSSGCISSQVPCDQLPEKEAVLKIMEENEDTVKQIESITDTGSVWIEVDSESCPGKAYVIIYYGTVYDKKEIKEIIGEDFFGVPYRMFNV